MICMPACSSVQVTPSYRVAAVVEHIALCFIRSL